MEQTLPSWPSASQTSLKKCPIEGNPAYENLVSPYSCECKRIVGGKHSYFKCCFLKKWQGYEGCMLSHTEDPTEGLFSDIATDQPCTICLLTLSLWASISVMSLHFSHGEHMGFQLLVSYSGPGLVSEISKAAKSSFVIINSMLL